MSIHVLLSRVVARYVTLLDRNRYNIMIEKKMGGWLVVVAVAAIVIKESGTITPVAHILSRRGNAHG